MRIMAVGGGPLLVTDGSISRAKSKLRRIEMKKILIAITIVVISALMIFAVAEAGCPKPTPTPEPTPTPTPPPPKGCVETKEIWVWKLFMPDGSVCLLRDLGYDGTYSSPGVAQQMKYCGCEVAVNAHGYYVTNCDDGYDYWEELPRFNGCGLCE
jgi:hypothetical protein